MSGHEADGRTRFWSPARSFGFSASCCIETEAANGNEDVVAGFDIDGDESSRTGQAIVGEFL